MADDCFSLGFFCSPAREHQRFVARHCLFDLRKRVWSRLIEMFICFLYMQAVTFYQCINLVVSNLMFKDAQQMHLTFQKCTNVKALNLRVVAPGNSPNTDGIHITETQNAIIRNCVIGTGTLNKENETTSILSLLNCLSKICFF